MSLAHLWAGWRFGYVSDATEAERRAGRDGARPGDGGCVFCRLAEVDEPSADTLVVWRGEEVFCALNLYPYGSGHLLVMPRRHVADLSELTSSESGALWEAVRAAVAADQAAYGPDGFNLGANLGRSAGAGIPQHLHLHVVPRWAGDTSFMTAVAGTRVLPEPLAVSWEKVHSAWPDPGPG